MSRSFRQLVDATDPNFVLLLTQIPNGGMPQYHYVGSSALERLERFARTLVTSYLANAVLPPPSSEAGSVYVEDAALESGYEFLQAPEGKIVHLRIRLPKADLKAPKAWYGDSASDRLVSFLHQWLAERDAVRSPAFIAKTLREGAATAGVVGCEIVARGWRWRLLVLGTSYHFEAQLYRRNGSTESDWKTLGETAAAIGAPHDPLTPLQNLAPTEPIVWEWTE